MRCGGRLPGVEAGQGVLDSGDEHGVESDEATDVATVGMPQLRAVPVLMDCLHCMWCHVSVIFCCYEDCCLWSLWSADRIVLLSSYRDRYIDCHILQS